MSLKIVFIFCIFAAIRDDITANRENNVIPEIALLSSKWLLLEPGSKDFSYGFTNSAMNYTCPQVSCIGIPRLIRESLLHFIAGVEQRYFLSMIYSSIATIFK